MLLIASLQSNLHTAQSNDLRCTVRLPESDNGSRSELKPAILQGNPAEVSAMFSAKKNRHRMHRVARIETMLETKKTDFMHALVSKLACVQYYFKVGSTIMKYSRGHGNPVD